MSLLWYSAAGQQQRCHCGEDFAKKKILILSPSLSVSIFLYLFLSLSLFIRLNIKIIMSAEFEEQVVNKTLAISKVWLMLFVFRRLS